MDELIQRRFQTMFDSAVEGLWIMTPDHQVAFYNQSFYEQFNLHSTYTTLDQWIDLIHPDDKNPFSSNVETHEKAVGDETRVITRYRVKKKDGTYVWIEATGINKVDGSGEYMVGNHRDITDQKELEDSIRQLAFYDKYTQLPNREKLKLDLTRRKTSVTLITVHASSVKSYISQYSEFILTDFIDSFLQCFDVFKNYDSHCYRTSLDTFTLLINERLSDDELALLADQFIREFNHKTKHTISYFGNVYLGIYACIDDQATPENIINSSYQTCEYAFEQSTKNWVIYNDEIKPEIERYFYVENHIKQAIKDNDISIYLQPIVNAKTGQLLAFEALARWKTDAFGFIRPDEFIPVAERLGLISKLGKKIFEKSADFIVKYNAKWNSDVKVHVNISALQLLEDTFPNHLLQIAKEKGAAPKHLVIELTESVLIDNNHLVNERLVELSEMGFPLAMDDFGAGYSSVTSLFKLPFKMLKIDKELANQSLSEKEALEYVQFLASLCESKNMKMTIEGIETKEMIEVLSSVNATAYQGYLISRPVPDEQALLISDCFDFELN